MKVASKTGKLGMALMLAVVAASASAHAQSSDRHRHHAISGRTEQQGQRIESGAYHEERLPDGTISGPLAESANGS